MLRWLVMLVVCGLFRMMIVRVSILLDLGDTVRGASLMCYDVAEDFW